MPADTASDGIGLALAVADPPFYLYSLSEVRAGYRQLRAALPEPSEILYSLKANPHPELVRTLRAAGAGAEICSPGELDAAEQAGLPLDTLLYTGPGKRDAEVVRAIHRGVRRFSVDSLVGLRQVDAGARSAGVGMHCLLRLNDAVSAPGQGLAMTGQASQFGIDVDLLSGLSADFAPYLQDRCEPGPGATIVGFHIYQGSNLDSEEALIAQFEAVLTTCSKAAAALRTTPRILDLGGGFGAPYARSGQAPPLTTLAGRLAARLDHHFPGWRRGAPRIAFESGRYLVGRAGELLTRVADVKTSHGRRVVVLESGINHLGGMSGLRRLPPIVPDLLTADAADRRSDAGVTLTADVADASDADAGNALAAEAMVAGPLCTPLDSWARSAPLGPLRPGDLVRVPNVGAYGLSASLLAFLGHPCPAEVVLDGDTVTSVTRLDLVRRPVFRQPDTTPARPTSRQRLDEVRVR